MELNASNLPPPGLTDSQADLPTPQRLAYAGVLNWGTSLGLAGLFVAFAVYVSGIVPPVVPHDELPAHWGKPLEQFHEDARIHERFGTHHGFTWLTHLDLGDFLVYLPVALLAGITIACYAFIVPFYVRQRSWLLLGVALAQLLVLVLAAAGVAQGD